MTMTMMKIPAARIVFPKEDQREILSAVEECLTTGALTLGKYTKQFEEAFAQYIGTKYAIAVNSGTSAIEIILRSLDVRDREVIVPTNTFFATPAAALHAGGKVVFCDCHPDHFSMDLDSLKKVVSPRTKVVIVVHIGGIVHPQIEQIQHFCKERNLFLVEDAAHAHGSSFNGKKAGTFGIAAAFSFYPTKVMTSAEGGMIVTDDAKINEEARIYRDQGKAGFTSNFHTHLGYNWRMSEIHAACGLSQLKRLEEFVESRRKAAAIYDRLVPGVGKKVRVLPIPPNSKSNYYKYIIRIQDGLDRAALKKALKGKWGVSLSGEVYEWPCHVQPIFKDAKNEGAFPKAEELCRNHVCLPVYAGMTPEEAEYVVASLEDVLKNIE